MRLDVGSGGDLPLFVHVGFDVLVELPQDQGVGKDGHIRQLCFDVGRIRNPLQRRREPFENGRRHLGRRNEAKPCIVFVAGRAVSLTLGAVIGTSIPSSDVTAKASSCWWELT